MYFAFGRWLGFEDPAGAVDGIACRGVAKGLEGSLEEEAPRKFLATDLGSALTLTLVGVDTAAVAWDACCCRR